ncbi:MAG TPA: VWA domain-containing protein [bacterium]|nr:VWA domain-containing protein [bacterium]
MIRFADPWFLCLFAVIPPIVWIYIRRQRKGGATLRFSHLGFVKDIRHRGWIHARHLLLVLRILAIALLILAFARPQSGIRGEEILTEGVDIMLVLDLSTSMLAEDIKPNRIEAVKEVAADFVRQRGNDRIGLVVFAREAYTQCPLTIDYGILIRFLQELKTGMIEDGTAIGMGLAAAVNRLRSSSAKSKVIILLTDGENNAGEIDPITAAQMAEAFGIKIYTVGASTHGTAMYPVQDPFFGKRYVPIQVDIDERPLRKIAELTGGMYFRATDRARLEEIYREIDRLEKTEIKVTEYTRYTELFFYFVAAALAILLVEIVLTHTRFRKIP